MTIMKSYTDIEQSKKLAEFLPLESADMSYRYYSGGMITGYGDCVLAKSFITGKNVIRENDLPCWSFAALFNVMPQINEWITSHGHKNDKLSQFEPKICKIWEHSIVPSYKVTYGNELSTDIYDNPVDACVDMIEKLHVLKML